MWVAKIKSKIRGWFLQISLHLTRRMVLLALGVLVGIVTVGLLVSYAVPRTIRFSFASGTSCVVSPVVFPASVSKRQVGTFALHYDQTLSVAHLVLYAGKVCAVPQQAPKATAAYSGSFAFSRLSPLKKKLTIRTSQYTRVVSVTPKKPLALTNALSFQLSEPDNTFTYGLEVNGTTGTCTKNKRQLMCPLQRLGLQYGQQYHARLVRTFGRSSVQKVTEVNFQTLTATSITTASVANGSTIYDKPQQFTFQADKPLVALGQVTLSVKKDDGAEQPVATAISFKDNVITLNASEPLPRKVTMHVVISSLKAQDSSGLVSPYDISFNVSGGPQVTSTSLAKYNVTAGPISLTFDQAIDPNQDTSQITLQADGTPIATRMTISGSRVTITPQTAYPVCAHLKLTVGSGIANPYGISGDSTYVYTARARCYTTFSIGTSVQGRSITAYKIGSGSTQLLFIGTMHGNEQNSGALLDKWLGELEANVDSIPAGRSVVIIPRSNPDGVAANTRVNASSIDLNRNFASANWKSVVTEPDGSTGPYGGPNPLSEPESQAIANYVQAQQPRVTVDYHSHGGIVQSNGTGDADSLALQYAHTSGYSFISSLGSGSVFDYDTTGSFEDWTNEHLGLSEFIVELTSATNDEFTKNRTAMWNLVKGS